MSPSECKNKHHFRHQVTNFLEYVENFENGSGVKLGPSFRHGSAVLGDST